MSLIRKIVWYVEANLGHDISLSDVARATGASRFHITRLFAVATGRPLMAYVRARRLSEAARGFMAGIDTATILDVALGAGYASHEAFTRAFRAEFGLSPKRLRQSGDCAALPFTDPFTMNDLNPLPPQTPRMADAPAMIFAGLARTYDFNGLTAIPGQWQAFRPWFGHIDGQVGGVTYGVSYNFRADGFDYMSGVEVDGTGILPGEFATLKVERGHYAVFEHRGHVSGIADTWRHIYDEWLTAAGLAPRPTAPFERMDERFDGATGNGVIEIWIPVA